MVQNSVITVIGNRMYVQASIFANVWSQIKQIGPISNFQPPEVASRGSMTQLQVDEKFELGLLVLNLAFYGFNK